MNLRTTIFSLILILLLLSATLAFSDGNAIADLEKDLNASSEAYNQVNAYKGTAHMQERIKGKIKGTEKVDMTFQKSPKAIGIQWLDGGLYSGMQLTHVASRDGADRFQALPTGALGIAGVQTLGFDSKLVKFTYPHHHRPIDYHIGFVLKNSKNFFEKAKKEQKLEVTCKGSVANKLIGRQMKLYELRVDAQKGQGFAYQRAEIGFDSKTKLPLYVKTYDFNGNLYESYLWSAFSINPKVDPAVFVIKK